MTLEGLPDSIARCLVHNSLEQIVSGLTERSIFEGKMHQQSKSATKIRTKDQKTPRFFPPFRRCKWIVRETIKNSTSSPSFLIFPAIIFLPSLEPGKPREASLERKI